MKIASAVAATAALGVLLGVEPVAAQTTIQEYCKAPNATVIVVELQNGKKLELALTRDGSKMKGTVGSDAGSATVQGEFSGTDVYWEVAFQDSSKVLLRGQVGNGEGNGVSQMGGSDAQMKWTARTAVGCARWPDGKPITAEVQKTNGPPAGNQATTLLQQATPQQQPQPQQQQQAQPQQQKPKPQVQIQATPQVQRAATTNQRCPEGTVASADGQCVRKLSPLMLPFQLILPGLGGVDVRVGR